MESKSFFNTEVSPFKQAGIVLALGLVFMGLSTLIPESPYAQNKSIQAWVVMCGLILFYAIANSVLSLATKDSNKYYLHSIISFVAVLVLGGLMAWGFSGVSIGDAASVKWIYMVFTFGYLVFLSIVNLIKFLVQLAQRKDERFK